MIATKWEKKSESDGVIRSQAVSIERTVGTDSANCNLRNQYVLCGWLSKT